MRSYNFRRSLRKVIMFLKGIIKGIPRISKNRSRLRMHNLSTRRTRYIGFRRFNQRNSRYMRICIAAIAFVTAAITISLIIPTRRVHIHPNDVAAFRIPPRSILTLRALSESHALDFPEALAVYSLENNFFAVRQEIPPAETIEHMFIHHYDDIRAGFRRADILLYEEMFRNILTEIRFFPIPIGFDNEFEPSYMYGDSFNTHNAAIRNPRAGGTDIFDRENVPGRVPAVAMASGTVIRSGRTNNLGYRVEIRGERGTVFTYAHLHTITESVRVGETIVAGEIIGSIGNSGIGQGRTGNQAPVRLHLTISPQTRLTMSAFYINPYPFLRLIEEFRIDLRQPRFDPTAPHMFPPPFPHAAPQPAWHQPLPQPLPRF